MPPGRVELTGPAPINPNTRIRTTRITIVPIFIYYPPDQLNTETTIFPFPTKSNPQEI
jgi:hypothetical protein